MSSLTSHLFTALALVFVIEGLLYAVFPSHVQKMMAIASDIPAEKLDPLARQCWPLACFSSGYYKSYND